MLINFLKRIFNNRRSSLYFILSLLLPSYNHSHLLFTERQEIFEIYITIVFKKEKYATARTFRKTAFFWTRNTVSRLNRDIRKETGLAILRSFLPSKPSKLAKYQVVPPWHMEKNLTNLYLNFTIINITNHKKD